MQAWLQKQSLPREVLKTRLCQHLLDHFTSLVVWSPDWSMWFFGSSNLTFQQVQHLQFCTRSSAPDLKLVQLSNFESQQVCCYSEGQKPVKFKGLMSILSLVKLNRYKIWDRNDNSWKVICCFLKCRGVILNTQFVFCICSQGWFFYISKYSWDTECCFYLENKPVCICMHTDPIAD